MSSRIIYTGASISTATTTTSGPPSANPDLGGSDPLGGSSSAVVGNAYTGPTYEEVSIDRMEELSGKIDINYQESSAVHSDKSLTFPVRDLSFELISETRNPITPGSVWFEWAGNDYIDRDGVIYKSPSTETGAGIAVGTINYGTRIITFSSWEEGATGTIIIHSALTRNGLITANIVTFRTPGAPLRPTSLQVTATAIDGTLITGTADADGYITGSNITGAVNVEMGIAAVRFTSDKDDITGLSEIDVDPSSVRYNAVMYSYLPLDADLIGLDPVRLPSDGRVPIFRPGDVVVISHTDETNISTPSAGQVISLGRDHQVSIEVKSSNGTPLKRDQYTVDLPNGKVTMSPSLSLTDESGNVITGPFSIHDRIEHMSACNDIQVTGEVSIIAPSPHSFPGNSVVASALTWGDISSKWNDFYTQKSWNSGAPNWTNTRQGDSTTANFNLIDYPVEVFNNGAVTEKWAIVFTSGSTFQVVGQSLGVISTGDTSSDLAVNNPNTNQPYFVVRADGWGSGWVAGNAIRFDSEGCLAPLWIARTVVPGQAELDNDQFVIQIRGDY